MKKQYIYAIVAGLALAILAFFGGRWTAPNKTETIKGVDQIVYEDTCMYSQTIIANVTTHTTSTHEQKTKPGKIVKDTSTLGVTEVSKKDSVYTTTFEKSYDTGLMKLKVKTTVEANSPAKGKIDIEYQLDTIALKEMTTITNTVVVQEDGDNSTTVKYLPIKDASKKTWLGIGGGLLYNEKVTFDIGPTVRVNNLSMGLYKNPYTKLNNLEGYRFSVNKDLIKLSN